MTTILTITNLEAFIGKMEADKIKGLLLQREELEVDKNNLLDKFNEFEDEDTFFFEESILGDKFIELENELDKFSVSARGRDWRRIIADDCDYITVGDAKIFTPQVLMDQHYGESSTSRYNLINKNIYKIHFDLFRVRDDNKPILTFYLEKVNL